MSEDIGNYAYIWYYKDITKINFFTEEEQIKINYIVNNFTYPNYYKNYRFINENPIIL